MSSNFGRLTRDIIGGDGTLNGGLKVSKGLKVVGQIVTDSLANTLTMAYYPDPNEFVVPVGMVNEFPIFTGSAFRIGQLGWNPDCECFSITEFNVKSLVSASGFLTADPVNGFINIHKKGVYSIRAQLNCIGTDNNEKPILPQMMLLRNVTTEDLTDIFSISTQVAAPSDGSALPAAVINVESTAGFPPTGTISLFLDSDGSTQVIDYGGLTPTSFTNCSGGSGTLSTGDYIQIGQVLATSGQTGWEFVFDQNPSSIEPIPGGYLAIQDSREINLESIVQLQNGDSLSVGGAFWLFDQPGTLWIRSISFSVTKLG